MIPTSARLNVGHQPKSMKSVIADRRRTSRRFPAAPPSAAPAPSLASSVCSPTPVPNSTHTEMSPITQESVSERRPRRCVNADRTDRISRMRGVDGRAMECDERVRTHDLVPWSSARTRMPATTISTARPMVDEKTSRIYRTNGRVGGVTTMISRAATRLPSPPAWRQPATASLPRKPVRRRRSAS